MCQPSVGNSANLRPDERFSTHFWRKSPIGTTLVKDRARIDGPPPDNPKKGRLNMSDSKFHRHLIAAFASLLMSSIAVGAAVAPAQVSAANVEVVSYV
jgi:hypothetical protein